MHRDIKPQNLLVDPTNHVLKICDFGSAKVYSNEPGNVSVPYMQSRFYRAPELIFGCVDYNNAIDIWSVGCVISEIITGEPLFQGKDAQA